MILLIDNYDSFTYNIVQYLKELNANVVVHYNDQITLAEITELNPDKIIISPGPGNPEGSGITLALVNMFAGKIPLLGICLGHQAIAQAFGGDVTYAKKPMHGKITTIYHNQTGILTNLKNPFNAARYHSLIVSKKTLPSCFITTAWTQDEKGNIDEIMGIRHKDFLVEGIQFHPESIGTEHGHAMLNTFLKQST